MIEYHKIDSVFKRDPDDHHRTFLKGEWSRPEFEYLADVAWVGTEKIDGTNIRISASGIGGRTDRAQLPAQLVPRLEAIRDRLASEETINQVTLYGEGYGAGIQKGGSYRPDVEYVLFDVRGESWWSREAVERVAGLLEIPVVPVVGVHTLTAWVMQFEAGWSSESLLHPGALSEGVVLRPAVELADYRGRRVITKLKHRDFGWRP